MKMDLPVLAPVTFEANDMLIGSFRSILGVMDLAHVILKTMKSLHMTDKLRVSLYGQPMLLENGEGENEKKFSAQPSRQIRELHSMIPVGALYAFARFSSALSLDTTHYAVDYAGVISSSVYPQPLEIYRIIINETGR